jgi:hypothetical protein
MARAVLVRSKPLSVHACFGPSTRTLGQARHDVRNAAQAPWVGPWRLGSCGASQRKRAGSVGSGFASRREGCTMTSLLD